MTRKIAAGVAFAVSAAVALAAGCKKREVGGEPASQETPERARGEAPATKARVGSKRAGRLIRQKLLIARADQARKSGNHQQAIRLYEKAAQTVSGSRAAAEAFRQMGDLFEERGERQRALAAYQQARAGSADSKSELDADLTHRMALIYEGLGKLERAYELMEEALQSKPDRLAYLADMARMTLARGEQKEAMRLLSHFETRRDQLIKKLDCGKASDGGARPVRPPADETGHAGRRKPQRAVPPGAAPTRLHARVKQPRLDPEAAKNLDTLGELGEVPDPKSAQAMVSCLRHPAPEVRRAAAALLGTFRYESTAKALRSRLGKEKNRRARDALEEAIRKVETKPRSQRVDLAPTRTAR
jgi:tetratricopeptide (TPR) repeat protein